MALHKVDCYLPHKIISPLADSWRTAATKTIAI
jgi:hypothetical protein